MVSDHSFVARTSRLTSLSGASPQSAETQRSREPGSSGLQKCPTFHGK